MTELIQLERRSLTPSRAESSARCHRRHGIAHLLGRGKTGAGATSANLGTVLHTGAGVWWETADENAVIAAVDKAYREEGIESHTIEEVQQMLAVYRSQATIAGPYTAIDEWKVVLSEERVKTTLGGEQISFKVDRFLEGRNTGMMLVVDLKSSSYMNARWREQWKRSLQQKLYNKVLRDFYDREIVTVIEGLQKKSVKVEYVVAPSWSQSQLDEAERLFVDLSKRDTALYDLCTNDGQLDEDCFMNVVLNETSFNYEDCYAYNTPCPFLSLCDAEPEERVGLLLSDYEVVEQEEY